MICPNCGKTSPFKTESCETCNYDFSEINASTRCSRIIKWVTILCITLLIVLWMLIQFDSPSSSTNSVTSIIFSKIIDTFVIIASISLVLCHLIIIFMLIRIALAQGKLCGYKFSTRMITVFAISLILMSGASSVSFYAVKFHEKITAGYFSEALKIYTEGHNGRIPSNENWINDIDPKAIDDYPKPQLPKQKPSANFAINSYVAGKDLNELPDNTVIAFETEKTLEHNTFYSSGIKPPKELAIYNDKYTACTVITKYERDSSVLDRFNVLPQNLAELNWMNTDKLSLPDTVTQHLSDKSAARLIADYIAIGLTLLAISIMVYLSKKGFGLQALSLTIISCAAGGYLGWLGGNLHCGFDAEQQAVYVSFAVSALIAATYSLLIWKIKSHLLPGYLRAFISAAATAAGVVCSTIVHLLFMLINYQWSPLALLYALGWGIAVGIGMGFAANYLIFRSLLKWQPCQPPRPSGAPPYEGGEQEPTTKLLPCKGEVADRPEGA